MTLKHIMCVLGFHDNEPIIYHGMSKADGKFYTVTSYCKRCLKWWGRCHGVGS